MYLLYIDHSGGVEDYNEKNFVMAGVAVFERQMYYIKAELERLQREYLPDIESNVELHASAIRGHNEPPWDKMPPERRAQLIADVYQAIAQTHQQGVRLFGQVLEKSHIVRDFPKLMAAALQQVKEAKDKVATAERGEVARARQVVREAKQQVQELSSPIIARGVEGLSTQFEFFLRRFYDPNQPEREQRGLMVFDHASYEKELELLMEHFGQHGTMVIRLLNIAEAPFCIDSKSTRMLQVADFVSNALYRRYESGDASYLDLIISRFDELDGVMHGLAHITSKSACKCPACLSRTLMKKRR